MGRPVLKGNAVTSANWNLSGRSKSSFAKPGVVIGVALLMFFATACGQGGDGDDVAAAADTQERLLALREQTSGTSVQQSASDFLKNHIVDVELHQCMATFDMPYPIRYFDGSIGRRPSSPGVSWASPLMDDTVFWNLQVYAEKHPQIAKLEKGPPEGAIQYTADYSRALATCEDEVGWPKENFAEPKDPNNLAYSLYELVTSTEAEFGDVQIYDRCMADAGFDVVFEAEDFSGSGGLYQLLWGSAPDWGEIPEVGAEGGRAWNEYLTWARKVLEADADCRETRHVDVISALGPLLSDFEEDNAQALAEIDAAWSEIVTQAEAKGWVDQTNKYQTVASATSG